MLKLWPWILPSLHHRAFAINVLKQSKRSFIEDRGCIHKDNGSFKHNCVFLHNGCYVSPVSRYDFHGVHPYVRPALTEV